MISGGLSPQQSRWVLVASLTALAALFCATPALGGDTKPDAKPEIAKPDTKDARLG